MMEAQHHEVARFSDHKNEVSLWSFCKVRMKLGVVGRLY